VACLPEAIELREGGVRLRSSSGLHDPAFAGEMKRYGIHKSVGDLAAASALSAAAMAAGKTLNAT
jgi:alanine racemase